MHARDHRNALWMNNAGNAGAGAGAAAPAMSDIECHKLQNPRIDYRPTPTRGCSSERMWVSLILS